MLSICIFFIVVMVGLTVFLLLENHFVSSKNELYTILQLQGHVEDVEYQVRCSEKPLVILDMGLDSDTQEICRRLESSMDGVVYFSCRTSELTQEAGR